MCVVLTTALVGACEPPAVPVAIRLNEDACAHCRMTIVSTRTAAQIITPGVEPIVFDDLGCLQQFRAKATLPPDAVVFVMDHQASEWIDERQAVITRTSEATPMGSGLVAVRRKAVRP